MALSVDVGLCTNLAGTHLHTCVTDCTCVKDAIKGYTVFRAAAKSVAVVEIPFRGGFANADIFYVH